MCAEIPAVPLVFLPMAARTSFPDHLFISEFNIHEQSATPTMVYPLHASNGGKSAKNRTNPMPKARRLHRSNALKDAERYRAPALDKELDILELLACQSPERRAQMLAEHKAEDVVVPLP